MDADPDMLNWRANKNFTLLFGGGNIIERLLECVQALSVAIYHPPTATDIAEEMQVLMPALEPEGQDPGIPQVQVQVHLS